MKLIFKIRRYSMSVSHKTWRLLFEDRSANDDYGNSCCLFWESYGTCKCRHCVGKMQFECYCSWCT